jgi:hypothetical protein
MIMLQKWRVISLVVLGISAVLVLDTPPAIAESPFHPQCSLQSVRGTYGVFFVVSDQGLQQTFAGVAVITADGKGNFLGTETFNSGSQVCTNVELSGTYTVNANCTGTTSVTFTGCVSYHRAVSSTFWRARSPMPVLATAPEKVYAIPHQPVAKQDKYKSRHHAEHGEIHSIFPLRCA